jgi:hypothetical protein
METETPMENQNEIEEQLASAGELLIRAAARLGALSTNDQDALRRRTNGELHHGIALAIKAAAAISPQIVQSLKTHPPVGFDLTIAKLRTPSNAS